MNVQLLTEEFHQVWNDFVISRQAATFYHRLEWKFIIEKSFNHPAYYFIAIDASNNICGILPLIYINSRLFGRILASMPFLNFGGIVADNAQARDLLISAAEEKVKELGADYVELRHLSNVSDDLPTSTHKVSMTIELNPNPQILWDAFTSKHRREIRKGENSGLKFRMGGGEHLEDFFRLMCQGWRDLGTPFYSIDFFNNIIAYLGDAIEISVVEYQGKPIATAMDGLKGEKKEGMWTYSLREYRHLNSNYFLYWQLIKEACVSGYKYFHLGRSTANTGATFFKQKWNAVEVPLFWQYILNEKSAIPQLNVNNPKYKFMIKVWQRLPVSLTQVIGPPIAKNIP